MLAIDGDTIADGHERIRIVGFNAPELHHAACPRELELAVQAKEFLARWLQRRPILVRIGTDKYGRTLAHMVPNPAPEMIALGLAEPYLCGPRCPPKRNWCEGSQ